MIMKKIMILVLVMLVASGCINTLKHVPLGQTVNVYRPTTFVACNAVGVWWNDSYNARYPIEASWMKLTWFVWIVDLPCEVVMDTVWFPYDYYCMRRYEKKQLEKANRHSRFGAEMKSSAYDLKREYSLDIDD